jgi:hypothetical protein
VLGAKIARRLRALDGQLHFHNPDRLLRSRHRVGQLPKWRQISAESAENLKVLGVCPSTGTSIRSRATRLKHDPVKGILERGVLGLYMPEFDLAKSIDEYLSSVEWNEMLGRWEGFVRAVVETKGNPPRLY